MRVCITKPDMELLFLELDDGATGEDVKVFIEIETGFTVDTQALFFQGRVIQDTQRLADIGVQNDDVLQVHVNMSGMRRQAIELIQQYNSSAYLKDQITQGNPSLASALETGDPVIVEEILISLEQTRREKEMQKQRQIMQMNADPFDIEAQRKIEEMIQKENIHENYSYAQEYTPEVFGQVTMLYIQCSVNKIPLQAFVDSGAQMTIISQRCADRVGLMRLVDRRFQGQAVGVGVDKIIGRIHAANIEIGGKFLSCSFTVLEKDNMDLLFGLDMLKRHQCCIDLQRNILSIGSADVSVPFLAEADISSPVLGRQTSIESQRSQPQGVQSNNSEEEKLQQLMRHGVSRQDAAQILQSVGGNLEMAETLILQQKFNFPEF